MAMTLGKDVSALFPDVLKNIATADLEQKKLVYLYLMWVIPNTLRGTAYADHWNCIGTTPNHTLTFAFSLSTHSYRTRKIPTR